MLEGAEGEPFIGFKDESNPAAPHDMGTSVFYLNRVTSFTEGSTPSVNSSLRGFATRGFINFRPW